MADEWGSGDDDDVQLFGMGAGWAHGSGPWCVAPSVALAAGGSFSSAASVVVAQQIVELQRDKRGGSMAGRPKKKLRLVCQWPEQYLGPNPLYSASQFRDRFGVPHVVFNTLLDAVRDRMTVGADCFGTPGMPADLAVLYTLRRLRTGLGSDQFDDQVGFGKSTLANKFVAVILAGLNTLAPTHLPQLDVVRHKLELELNEEAGWPGCFGSYDAMHCKWNAPKRVQALARGRHQSSNLLVAAVAHHDLYVAALHLEPGSMNDLNARDTDPLQEAITFRGFGQEEFTVPGEDEPFGQQYVLGDGIFAGETWIVGPVGDPVTEREKTFTRDHESKRKDVERLFGVVQGRFKMVRSGNRIETADFNAARDVVRFCFMLHNMIVKLVGDGEELDEGGVALSHNDVVEEFKMAGDSLVTGADFAAAKKRATDKQERHRLTAALARYRQQLQSSGG
jgi:hypothetical protein